MLRRFSRLGRFRIVGEKPPVKKIPAQKIPVERDVLMELTQEAKRHAKIKQSYGSDIDPTKLPLISAKQEQISKLIHGRFLPKKEKSNITKVRSIVTRKYGNINKINDPSKVAQIKRLEAKAFTSAEKLSKFKEHKLSEKYGVAPRRFGERDVKKSFLSSDETRELGFAEREMSSAAKYQYAKSKSPAPKIKKLESLYNQPKYKKYKQVIKERIGALKYEQKLSNVTNEYTTFEKEVRPKTIKFFTDEKGQLKSKYVYGKPKWQKMFSTKFKK